MSKKITLDLSGEASDIELYTKFRKGTLERLVRVALEYKTPAQLKLARSALRNAYNDTYNNAASSNLWDAEEGAAKANEEMIDKAIEDIAFDLLKYARELARTYPMFKGMKFRLGAKWIS